MTIAEHDIPPRWHITGRVLEVFAVDASTARMDATRQVHIAESLPPWKPLLRVTYAHTDASALAYAPSCGPASAARSSRRRQARRHDVR